MAIDNALRNVGLQRIVNYPYIVGDCLFDSISYLLHGIVCSNVEIICLISYIICYMVLFVDIKLRKGSLECLSQALIINDYKVEHYLRSSLSFNFLMSSHGVNFVENYLNRMECGASNNGLWADFTILFWLCGFIKRPIEAWSIRTCKPYMNVGDKFNTNEKLILAYHEGMNGHFESVKRLEIYNSSSNNNISNMQKKKCNNQQYSTITT
jgi:hypothetical protein